MTALAAALTLLLQLFFAGAVQAAPQHDAFGNPLCISAESQGSTPAPDGASLLSCCVAGCIAAPALGPAPDGAVFARLDRGFVPAPAAAHMALPAPARGGRPGSPRAPPSSV